MLGCDTVARIWRINLSLIAIRWTLYHWCRWAILYCNAFHSTGCMDFIKYWN